MLAAALALGASAAQAQTIARAPAARGAVAPAEAQGSRDIGEMMGRAWAHWTRGEFVQAEREAQRAIALAEARGETASRSYANAIRLIGSALRRHARLPEAEATLRRALALTERAYGAEDRITGHALNQLAGVLHERGNLAEAQRLAERAYRIALAQGGAELPWISGQLAQMHADAGRLAEAEALLRRALPHARRHADPAQAHALQRSLATVLVRQGRMPEAEAAFRRALASHEANPNASSADLIWTLYGMAAHLALQGRGEESLQTYRRLGDILRQRSDAYRRSAASEEWREGRRYRTMVARYLEQIHLRLAADSSERERWLGEAHAIIQIAKQGGTAASLARMVERLAAQNEALAQLVRRRGDAMERLNRAENDLYDALGQPASRAVSRLREAVESARAATLALDAQIRRQFPAFARLLGSGEAPHAELQAALQDGEALLDYFISGTASFVLVTRRDRAALVRIRVGATQLEQQIAQLRAGLDPARAQSLDLVPNYDLAGARRLHDALIAPAAAQLDGAGHLIIAPDGALASLPFSALVRALAPARGADGDRFAAYRRARWLADDFAVTLAPAASSVRALRELAQRSRATLPFIGFGDPALAGAPGGGEALRMAALFTRGAVADVARIRQLPRLPETAQELRAIARSLGAASDSVILREAATERAVRTMDLSRYRVLAFATHGLTAGEIPDHGEPGLILTPPARPTRGDDGVLEASAVAALRLDADLVILSACNTAASDGRPDGQALSGLARAFLYAGARALLVSNWAVSSEAAARLTTGFFDEAAADPAIGRAEALRRSMQRMIRGEEAYLAHPLFWAPFIVVGEGGRPLAVTVAAAGASGR
jgi:CHAT domain-containing protein